MATQNEMTLHFVLRFKRSKDWTKEMWQAVTMCTELKMNVKKISEQTCQKILTDCEPLNKKDVFVLETFNNLFEQLKNYECVIISPTWLLTCLKYKFKINSSPKFKVAFKGVSTCIYGLTPEIKEFIQLRIEYMGGIVSEELKSSVTHLIINSVMSAECEKAKRMKISIMTVEWIEEVWQVNCQFCLKAIDKKFDKYKCDISHNLTIRSTNSICQQGGNLERWPQEGGSKKKSSVLPSNLEKITEEITEETEKLFQGKIFEMAGLYNEDNHVEETIITLGGRFVPRTYSGIIDYGVVPINGAPLKYTVNEIVNDLFIEDCKKQNKIVDILYYHRPLSIKPCKILSNCVITIFKYSGSETLFLSILATTLGAICQNTTLTKKGNAEKNRLGNTHLVCSSPKGKIYDAAVKWKLSVVTANWLKTCAAQLTLVDAAPFLVGDMDIHINTIGSEKSSVSFANICEKKIDEQKSTEETTPKTPVSPLCNLSQIQDTLPVETLTNDEIHGLVNQPTSPSPFHDALPIETLTNDEIYGLVNQPTSPSPFHISTPDTPYGQVFKPNPSPATRKGWLKWVNNFPDLQVVKPAVVIRPRIPSTPLSDLKRQLWDKLCGRNGDKSKEKEAEKKVDDQSEPSAPTLVNRRLDFDEEDEPDK